MVLFCSNLLIGINLFSRELYIIRIIAICGIIYILYNNSISSSIIIVSIVPLSIKRISYFDEVRMSKIIDSNSKNSKLWRFKDIENKISNFLKRLEFYDNYIVIMEFIPEKRYFEIDAPLILLSKPFMINRFSSTKTISNFIYERLDLMKYLYQFNNNTILECKYREGPIILLKYAKFYLS
jgi:hypothetical protein